MNGIAGRGETASLAPAIAIRNVHCRIVSAAAATADTAGIITAAAAASTSSASLDGGSAAIASTYLCLDLYLPHGYTAEQATADEAAERAIEC